ncbi:MAG: 4-hydroxy-3-methylbut-2-enyl diphosphate reductase [Coriobacteriales bacterium]|jgi:4-hydroxy-3-methylbut-2-enyl diphosphate reductase
MDIIVADPSGACYGVERARNMALEALGDDAGKGNVHTFGPLIHNPIVVADLEARGARVVRDISEMEEGTLVVRSHGITRGQYEEAQRRGLRIVNATCPHVRRVQQSAAQLAAEGRFVVIVGEKGHPEVEGILSHAGEHAAIVLEANEIPELGEGARVGVVVQTTQSPEKLAEIVDGLGERGYDVEVHDTICAATRKRQEAARGLAAQADVMVVIGGRNSGNTRRLAEICSEACPRTHHIETSGELEASWFAGARTVGVTAGASTPQAHVDAVVKALEEIA